MPVLPIWLPGKHCIAGSGYGDIDSIAIQVRYPAGIGIIVAGLPGEIVASPKINGTSHRINDCVNVQ